MERCLGEALSAGGDYADLYFEAVTSTSLGIDESLVKSASQGISVGCGIRVLSGERTGYAYTDDLSSDRLLRAARTAALIASGPAKEQMSGFRRHIPAHRRSCPHCWRSGRRRDRHGRINRSGAPTRRPALPTPRIARVRAGFNDELRRITGRPLRRTTLLRHPAARAPQHLRHRQGRRPATMAQRPRSPHPRQGGSGRVTLDFADQHSPEHYAREAARTAILQLNAIAAPAGEMPVVLGPGWPGVLLHEAVGHGLEADFNRKKTSAFAFVSCGEGRQRRSAPSSPPAACRTAVAPSASTTRGNAHTGRTLCRGQRHTRGYLSDKLSSSLIEHAQYRLRPPWLPPHPHAARGQHLHHSTARTCPEDIIEVGVPQPPRRQLRRRRDRYHQRQIRLLRLKGPTSSKTAKVTRAIRRRDPDRKRARSTPVRLHGRQRSRPG